MNQPNHHQIATYLTDYVLSELVKYVIEDTGCTTEQAMEQVYNSPLMTLLQDEEGELYVQSPAYLYELMRSQPKHTAHIPQIKISAETSRDGPAVCFQRTCSRSA